MRPSDPWHCAACGLAYCVPSLAADCCPPASSNDTHPQQADPHPDRPAPEATP